MPGTRGANRAFRWVRVLYNLSAIADADAATGAAILRPWPAGRRRRGSGIDGPRADEIDMARVEVQDLKGADRSAEDRRLRKAEAVGSNPTRSTLHFTRPGLVSRRKRLISSMRPRIYDDSRAMT